MEKDIIICDCNSTEHQMVILYSEDENELRQIEYLGIKQLYIDVYNDGGSHVGDLNVKYESLPGQILDELVEVLVNYRNV